MISRPEALYPILPLSKTQRPLDIIVVGAGVAGMCAAYELKKAGHSVTVLEAQHKAGGRVRTLRDFAEGLYVEEGSTRFPDCHHFTMHYIRHFGLPLEGYDRPELGSVLHIQDEQITHRHGAMDKWPSKLGLTTAERKMTLEQMMGHYLDPLLAEIGNPLAPSWPSQGLLERYDTISYGELLRQQGASDAAVRLLNLGFHVGEGIDSVSGLWMLRNMYLDYHAGYAYKIVGGNDLLPVAFARALAQEIRYRWPVTSLEQMGTKVTVHGDNRPALEADYVVCTLPFPIINRLKFEPPLSAQKQAALMGVPYASMSRVYLQSSSRFWVEHGHSGFIHTDLPMAEIWDVTVGEVGHRGVMMAYSGGEEARKVTAMKPDERLRYTVERMDSVLPGIREHFEGGGSTCWDTEPWALGAGAYYRPGDLQHLSHLATPEDRIHFAGEGTSPWPGWVQGSLESGYRVAVELNQL